MGKNKKKSAETRNHAINFRVDNISKEQAEALEDACIKKKREIAPDGRGTSLIGEQNQLSGKTPKEIKPKDN